MAKPKSPRATAARPSDDDGDDDQRAPQGETELGSSDDEALGDALDKAPSSQDVQAVATLAIQPPRPRGGTRAPRHQARRLLVPARPDSPPPHAKEPVPR